MTKTVTASDLAGSTAIPSGTAASAVLTEAEAAAQAKAAIEAAIVRFEGYGKRAAQGTGVVTEMAMDFATMCRDGTAKLESGEKLYEGYVKGFNRAKRADMDELEPKGYAQSLSTFLTFGLPYAVATGALKFYPELAAYRKGADKAGVASTYNCYAVLNRRLNDGVKKEGADAIMAMLADDEKRAEFIAACVTPKGAAAKDEFAKAHVLADGIERLAKKSEHALTDDWAALAKAVHEKADFLKALAERRKLENEALLIKRAA